LIQTTLQVEERAGDLPMLNLNIDSKPCGCHVVSLNVEDAAPHGVTVDRAKGPREQNWTQLLDLDLIPVTARNPEEVTRGLDMLDSAHVDAVNAVDGPLMYGAHASIVERLIRIRLPAIYPWPEIAEEGGLLSYGSRLEVQFRQMARLVSRILGGARPEDLPIEQPDRYDLAVNLKTAKTLGLTVPPSILARADEVVE
jgi:ABC-type uncharacterized transport system substrate-binding protein